MRDKYAADVVWLMFRYGGATFAHREVSTAHESKAFFVATYNSSQILAHELGHVGSLLHDRYEYRTSTGYVGDEAPYFPYLYGYSNRAVFDDQARGPSLWRTLMSYSNHCDAAGLHCPRISRYSNPERVHPDPGGHATGIPGVEPSGRLWGPVDAARALNRTRDYVANFRPTPEIAASFGAPVYTAVEGGDAATVTVRLSAAPERQMRLPIQANGVGAVEADWSGVPGYLEFAAADTEKTFDVVAVADAEDEAGEAVKLSFPSLLPSGVRAASPATAEVRLVDDGSTVAAASTYALADAEAAEGGAAELTVILGDAAPTGGLSFDVAATFAGSAAADDVGSVPAAVTVPEGSTTAAIVVPIRRDGIEESEETFTVGIAPGTGVSGWSEASAGAGTATVTITDRTEAISLSAATVTVNEGEAATWNVTRTGPATAFASIAITAAAGTAAGGDFSAAAAAHGIAAGRSSQSMRWNTIEDDIDEEDESFTLTLAAVASDGHRLAGGGTVTVTIRDDDTAGVTVDAPAASLDAGSSVSYTVALDSEPTDDVVIEATSSAPDRADVLPASRTFTADDWSTPQRFTLTGAAAGSVTIRHKASSNDAKYPADLSIDDVALTVRAVAPGAPEGLSLKAGQGSLTASWSPPGSDGGAGILRYGIQHKQTSSSNWPTAVTDVSGTTHDIDNLEDESSYDVRVRAVNSVGAGAWSATSTATTLPNGPPSPVGTLAARTLRVGEAAVTVDVSGAFRDPEGDALTYGAVSSAPGVASVSVSGSSVEVSPVSGGTATVTVKATDLSGSNTAAEQQFSVRVRNRRGVSVDPVSLSVTEGGSGTYDVALEAEPSASVTVTPSVPSGTDVTVSPQSLTFGTTGWGTAQPVTVSAAEDTDAVSDAPVVIRHTVSGGDYGSVTASSVTVTVLENDASAVSTSDVSVSEGGGDAVFEVSLSVAGTSDVLVDYATSDVSAEAGSDYTAVSGTLTFPQGSTAPREIRVSILDDALDETEEETFALTLRNVRNGLLAGGGTTLRVVGTIRDDDDPAVVASFARSSYEAPEGGSAPVHVILDRDPERTVTVPLESIHRGGASLGDYAGVPSEVTFSNGRLISSFLFLAVDDGDDDDGEAVEVRIGSPLPPGVSPGASAVLAIRDNDGGGNPGGGSPGGGSPGGGSPGGGGGGGGGGGPPPGGGGGGPGGGGGTPPGGGSGGPPPSGGGGGGPPRAAITTGADCGGTLCRARTGERVSFEDTGSGTVRSRLWDFGDGRKSRSRTTSQVWSEPGFYTVTLRVSDGTVESTASLTFLVEAAEPAGACVADDRTLCLGDSRYAVTVEWRTAGGESGAARVVHEGTNDSGLFHFFEPGDNWEVLIKVLDGCPVNGHVWMYAASTTDLGYTIEITDTATGMAREYRNEPGMPAPAITDVTAFAEGCNR